MSGGLFATAALTAVYSRLKETDATFALWALLLSIAGAFGAIIHGGYDLANAINPPAVNVSLASTSMRCEMEALRRLERPMTFLKI